MRRVFVVLILLALLFSPLHVSAVKETVGISPDKYDFELMIGDTRISLLSPVSELFEAGFEMKEDLSEVKLGMRALGYTQLLWDGESTNVSISALNLTKDRITADQGVLGIIELSARGDKKFPFTLSGGITDKSKLEDVLRVFGQPTKRKDDFGHGTILKYGDFHAYYDFTFLADGSIDRLNIHSDGMVKNPDNMFKTRLGVNKIGYDNEERYALSDDLWDFTFYLDYSYYQLPQSLKEMKKDGWVLMYREQDTLGADENIYGCVMEKNNQFMRVALANWGDVEIPIEEAELARFEVSAPEDPRPEECLVPLEIAHGIVLGQSTMEDVLEVLGDDCSISESTFAGKTVLRIDPPSDNYCGFYELSFYEEKLVRISMQAYTDIERVEPDWEEASEEFIAGVDAAYVRQDEMYSWAE